jgi:hypothetical protein
MQNDKRLLSDSQRLQECLAGVGHIEIALEIYISVVMIMGHPRPKFHSPVPVPVNSRARAYGQGVPVLRHGIPVVILPKAQLKLK